MKEKPILPLLTSMALPMVISMLVNSLYNIVDSFFVAQINEQAMAALSLVFPVQNFVNATAIGFRNSRNDSFSDTWISCSDHQHCNYANIFRSIYER